MKKVLHLLAGLIVCCSSIQAQDNYSYNNSDNYGYNNSDNYSENYTDNCCYRNPFDGFYAGVSGGVATHMAESKIFNSTLSIVTGLTESFEDLNYKGDLYEIQPWGEFFAGWGRRCGNFYWGARLGVNFSKFDVSLENNTEGASESLSTIFPDVFVSTNTSLKAKMSCAELTLDFKPGWIFCEKTMLFGLFGVAFNKQSLKGESRRFSTVGETVGLDVVVSSKKDKTLAGFRVGFGIEHMLSECLSLQLGYVYTRYSTLHSTGEDTFNVTSDFTLTSDFKTRLSKQVAYLGLAYYF